MRGRRAIALALSGLALLEVAPVQAAAPTERELKAAFVYNFPSYVEWPQSAFETRSTPLVIGILGDDPFGPLLDELVAGRTVSGRPLRVRRLRRVEEAAQGVHVLYLGFSDPIDIEFAARELSDVPVLTVADGERLAEHGAMINLRLRGRRVGFDINPAAADRAGLKLSSQLLKLARIVPQPAGWEVR